MFKTILVYLISTASFLFSAEFTISSYNCGGLSDHYDYLRAASMQKIMQERYTVEPETMALNEKIQSTALKILFSQGQEQITAQLEWDTKEYQKKLEHLIGAANDLWSKKVNDSITSYQIRPVVIHDSEVRKRIQDHLFDLTRGKKIVQSELLREARDLMAKRIFAHHLKYDIICLQEGDYLNSSLFPENYEVLFAETVHLKNGIAWNKERFKLVENLGDIGGKACVLQLQDLQTGKNILVASAHLSGCHPYKVEYNSWGIPDSAKGDGELSAVLEVLKNNEAGIKIIGMDSNVTSLHPRLNLLKEAHFHIDSENFLELTCTNPHQVLDTRIDWIAIEAEIDAKVINIPVLSVGLNNLQTNMSDHKPIAAKIIY